MDEKPNIIFILSDAVRAKNLSCYGYNKPTSPNIDRIAREGILFENAFSCINSTDSSLTTIFSGLYPLTHGIIGQGETITESEMRTYYRQRIVLLPKVLQKEGFKTYCLDWLGRWHKECYDYYMGISSGRKKLIKKLYIKIFSKLLKNNISYKIIQKFYKTRKKINVEWENATELTNKAIDLVKSSKEPFFLFIHYWDTHLPYDPPDRFVKKFNKYQYDEIPMIDILAKIKNSKRKDFLKAYFRDKKNTREVITRYDASINYVDYEIGRLMDFLDRSGRISDTLIIFTSDHGESLTEHGIYFDHHGLYDANLHVPLIISHPRLGKGRIAASVQHFDIFPTVLDFLNIEYNAKLDGISLLPLIFNKKDKIHDFIFAEEGYTQRRSMIRNHKYKYIFANSKDEALCRFCHEIHGNIDQLYDLITDPEESIDISFQNQNKIKNLKQLYDKWARDRVKGSEILLMKERIKKVKVKLNNMNNS